MGTRSLIVVLLISSTASSQITCPSIILKKFLSDSSKAKEHYQNGETISVTCLAYSGYFEYDYYANNDDNDGSETKDNGVVLNCTDGKWIGHYPECFKNCSKPDLDATLNPEYDLYYPGDNVTITACRKDSDRIEGDTTLICTADGTWIGSATCPKQHRSCDEQPPTINNSYIAAVVLDEYRHGTVLRYRCSQAYDQMGIYSVRCYDGRWIPDSVNLMRCIIGKCSPIYSQEIDNGRVKKIAGEVGTYAEFECYDGYTLDGSARILCMADRKWYPEIPKCNPVSCPSPKQPLHGRLVEEAYNGVRNIYLSTIRYDCDKGYRLVGPQFRKCQADRTWSGNDTKCEEILCDKPSPPQNGIVYLTDNSEAVGSQIEYICDEHYILEPITSQFAICTEHGHWSSPKPRCIKTCKVRALSQGLIKMNVRMGRKITEDTYVRDNTRLIFTCDNGYEKYSDGYETDGILICLNGTLFPGTPECRPQRCNLRNIDNGHFRQSVIMIDAGEKIQSGSNVRLVCADKYELYNERTYMYLELEQTDITCFQGSFTAEIPSCRPKRCNITEIEYGHFKHSGFVIVAGRKVQSGSNIRLICSDGYELYKETTSTYLELKQTDIKCYQGSFTAEIPSCKPKRCLIDTEGDLGYFIDGNRVLDRYTHNGTLMQARCPDGMELARSIEYLDREVEVVKCNMGMLEPGTLDCKDKRCNVIEIENGNFRHDGIGIVEGKKIQSGSNIRLVCSDGYQLYKEPTSTYLELEHTVIKCYQGSFTAEIPSCKPRRCLIDTEVDLEYFIDGNRILDRYIHNGTLMQARCPDGMELVRSIEYLDREEEYVKCNMGTWEPGTFDCRDKRCHVIEIENGHFRNSGFMIVAGNKIPSGRKISLICSDGYELYNERNSTYVELEQTKIKCYQGSFTTEIPSCKPKRCKADKSRNLLPEFNYVEHGTNLTVRCPDKMDLLRTGDIQGTSVLCSKGIWTPELPRCMKKFCNEPAFQYIIVQNGTLVNEDSIFSHGTKLKVSCDSSSILYGDKIKRENSTSAITECSHGEWKPNFSCKKTCTLPKGTFKFVYLNRQNITKKEGQRILEGRKMVPVCSSGHKEVKHSTCSNGTWVPSLEGCAEDIGRCSINNLPGMQFTYIGNGTVVADKHLEEGESVMVSCSFGYKIDTPSGSESGYEYDYSDSQSTTYSVEVPNSTDSDELRPISDGIHTCRKTGMFEPDIPFACKQIICHRLDDYEFENGRITYSLPIHYVGTVASFTCSPGYTRDGQANRTCQEDGTWSGTCVTCQRDERNPSTMCPVPCVPDWAIKSGSYTYDLGSRVEFQCLPTNMQYSGDSSNIRHCVNGSNSASWNGTLINCKGLNDVSLRMIAKGVEDEWRNLSRALDIPSNQVILSDDEPSKNALKILQFWRDIVMRGKPKSLIPDLIIVVEKLEKRDVAVALRSLNGLDNIRCKHPSLNGKVKPNQSDYLFGQSVRVTSCDDGYMLVNQSYLLCTENGTWFGNSTCRHAICTPECGINGKCVRDNECRCSEGYSGKTCDVKVKPEVECEPLADDYKVIQPGVVPGRLSNQTVVEISCNKSLAPYDDLKEATCYESIWHPRKPFCEIPCLLQRISGTQYNYNLSREKVDPGPVSSGRRVKVTCEKGFIPVPQLSKVSMCMNGVWNPDISRCEKEDCEIGKIYWNSTRYKRVRDDRNTTISYKGYLTDFQCYASCANDHRCKALFIYKAPKNSYLCKLFTVNTRNNPQAFVTQGVKDEHIYDKACNESAGRDGSV